LYFCNQKLLAVNKEASEEEIRLTIESYWKPAVCFCGNWFLWRQLTGISQKEQEWYLKLDTLYKRREGKQIRLSTRPDYINSTILDLLEKYGVRTIELAYRV
jgi:radical SAM superfamily enzyme YgiQ (UPF0313 family)